MGEMVLLCVHGMLKVTIGEESWVLREGDTVQARLDDGWTVEAIGDEEAEGLWVLASPALLPT